MGEKSVGRADRRFTFAVIRGISGLPSVCYLAFSVRRDSLQSAEARDTPSVHEGLAGMAGFGALSFHRQGCLSTGWRGCGNKK